MRAFRFFFFSPVIATRGPIGCIGPQAPQGPIWPLPLTGLGLRPYPLYLSQHYREGSYTPRGSLLAQPLSSSILHTIHHSTACLCSLHVLSDKNTENAKNAKNAENNENKLLKYIYKKRKRLVSNITVKRVVRRLFSPNKYIKTLKVFVIINDYNY